MLIYDASIDRILDGEASDEEAAKFQGWLKTPAHLERFAFRAELRADLRRSLRRRHIQNSALEASTGGPVTDAALPPDQRPSPVSRSHKRCMLGIVVFRRLD